MRWEIPDSETACSRFLLQTQTFWSTIWNRTIKMITKSAWALGLGGGGIINYSGTVTWEVIFCSSRLFSSFIRGAMNEVSSTFGKLNKQIQELSLLYVSVYLVVKMMNVQLLKTGPFSPGLPKWKSNYTSNVQSPLGETLGK